MEKRLLADAREVRARAHRVSARLPRVLVCAREVSVPRAMSLRVPLARSPPRVALSRARCNAPSEQPPALEPSLENLKTGLVPTARAIFPPLFSRLARSPRLSAKRRARRSATAVGRIDRDSRFRDWETLENQNSRGSMNFDRDASIEPSDRARSNRRFIGFGGRKPSIARSRAG